MACHPWVTKNTRHFPARVGEMLQAQKLAKGVRMAGRDSFGGALVEPPKKDTPTLTEVGISKKLSSKAQKDGAGMNEGGRPKKTGARKVPVSTQPTLAEVGISKKLQAQKEAARAAGIANMRGRLGRRSN